MLDGVIKHRSSRETTMVGRGASLDVRLFLGGTDGSNPVPSSAESASNRSNGSHLHCNWFECGQSRSHRTLAGFLTAPVDIRTSALVGDDAQDWSLGSEPQHRLDEIRPIRAEHPRGADDHVPRIVLLVGFGFAPVEHIVRR